MTDNMPCPKCGYEYTYELSSMWHCSDCGNEWNPDEQQQESNSNGLVVKDANGVLLVDGDTVVIIKDLPVKGSPKPIKGGTKVKNIRLRDSDHNIDCKIDGFGAMSLKSEFVKKG